MEKDSNFNVKNISSIRRFSFDCELNNLDRIELFQLSITILELY